MEVVKSQYVDIAQYNLEEVKNMPDHKLYCITKTPTTKAKKDQITNMKGAVGKQYLSKNGSSCSFKDHFDGEFTRKFSDINKANEVAQQIRAHTLIGKYTIAVEEIK